jgi:hypothetical protein
MIGFLANGLVVVFFKKKLSGGSDFLFQLTAHTKESTGKILLSIFFFCGMISF